jgi:outer membrane lipoprotein-sorting protein
MMKATWHFLLLGILIIGGRMALIAQETSDPAARKALNEVKAFYEKSGALQMDFKLTILPPEEDPIVQKGIMITQGNKYYMTLEDMTWQSDGKTIWILRKDLKEVQIHNVLDEAGTSQFVMPLDILRKYDNGDYIYASAGVGKELNRQVRYIEFKPKSREEDFFKVRLSLDVKKPEIVRFEAFARDGSRYILDINSTKTGIKPAADQFVFQARNHPGVAIEDLRLN